MPQLTSCCFPQTSARASTTAFTSRMEGRPAIQRVIVWERKTLAVHGKRHPAPAAAEPIDGV